MKKIVTAHLDENEAKLLYDAMVLISDLDDIIEDENLAEHTTRPALEALADILTEFSDDQRFAHTNAQENEPELSDDEKLVAAAHKALNGIMNEIGEPEPMPEYVKCYLDNHGSCPFRDGKGVDKAKFNKVCVDCPICLDTVKEIYEELSKSPKR